MAMDTSSLPAQLQRVVNVCSLEATEYEVSLQHSTRRACRCIQADLLAAFYCHSTPEPGTVSACRGLNAWASYSQHWTL
jgi:hypothetical protein